MHFFDEKCFDVIASDLTTFSSYSWIKHFHHKPMSQNTIHLKNLRVCYECITKHSEAVNLVFIFPIFSY